MTEANTINVPVAVLKYSQTLMELEAKYGELAEVKKAELQAEHDGFHGANVTEARNNSKFTAMAYTQDRYDLEADIQSLEHWIAFYKLLVEKDIHHAV